MHCEKRERPSSLAHSIRIEHSLSQTCTKDTGQLLTNWARTPNVVHLNVVRCKRYIRCDVIRAIAKCLNANKCFFFCFFFRWFFFILPSLCRARCHLFHLSHLHTKMPIQHTKSPAHTSTVHNEAPECSEKCTAIELLKKLVIIEWMNEWMGGMERDAHIIPTPAAGIQVTLKYELLSRVCVVVAL